MNRKEMIVVGIIVLVSLVGAGFASTSSSSKFPSNMYLQLASSVATSCCVQQEYPLMTANFSSSVAVHATIFVTVTVFVPVSSGCCIGSFAQQLQIDSGPLHQIGGGDTSRTVGIRVTLTSFERVDLSAGMHSVTLAVFNGGGSWTIDSGPLTALMIEFS